MLLQLESELAYLEAKVHEYQNSIYEIKKVLYQAGKVDMNLSKQVYECIRDTKEPITTDEVFKSIFWQNHDILLNTERRRNIIKQVSVIINRLKDKKQVCSINVNGHKGNFYYPSSWVDTETCQTKEEYKILIMQKLKNLIGEQPKAHYLNETTFCKFNNS